MDNIEFLKGALKKEKAARKQAEAILENKAAELYAANKKLEKSYVELEGLFKEKNSQLQGVFENIVDAYVIMDLMGNILKMNDSAVSLLGFDNSNQEFNLLEMVPPEEMQRVAKSFKLLYNQGSLTDFQLNIITLKKERRLVHINASIVYDKGAPVAAQGIIRDITESKKAENKLIESENRLATLILNLDSGVLLEDENHKIVLTNNKFCELFDLRVNPEEFTGKDFRDSVLEIKNLFEKPELYVAKINEILKNKTEVLGDELVMLSGKIVERDYIPIFEKNNHMGNLWSFRDVTLRRKYNKSIEAEKLKYSNIIANMNLGLVEVNNNDEILMVNQSFMKISGYSKNELIGKKSSDLFFLRNPLDINDENNIKLRNSKSDSYELKVNNKKGEVRYWIVSAEPNYNLNGEVVGSTKIHLDVTGFRALRKEKEKLLLELGKSNEELKEYAHIVSHDLKSPLRSINALVSWLKEDNEGKLDDVSMRNFELIEETLQKMEHLISDVLIFSSISTHEKEKTDVNLDDTITDLIKIMYKPEHIRVSILNTLPIIRGHKTKLQQLFQNLIGNAIKFIDKDKGFVNIDVEDIGAYYKFSIADNGIGIDKKFHDKIFKIFHVLNKSKDSTGIGLSIVKKIVNLHKGEIWIKSEPKKGTTFFFTLKK